ncbi:MAG TPA: DNA polymerase III subunit epsilon [Steroidobacteraceae bacterium]|nr:DNA polymerase III subunit epsilon [Steroidobacteraceae bacterium]
MRQIVLDTETTGLEVEQGHRIVEIGCIELVNRRATGREFHRYLNPEREIDEGAQAVHGLSQADLRAQPRFAEIAAELRAFVEGAELVIHNAPFDLGFVNAEMARAGQTGKLEDICRVLDTLSLARRMHPGQRNSLDALCKRYAVDNSRRDYHGALLDAHLLADVYLAMSGGQAHLTLGLQADGETGAAGEAPSGPRPRAGAARALLVRCASGAEIEAHERILDLLDKASAGRTVWRRT